MGQFIWMVTAIAAVVGVVAVSSNDQTDPLTTATETAKNDMVVESSDVESVQLQSSGSALAAAAFGLSALQPDTYNGELVLEIIDASHLEAAEKQALVSDIAAAEAGRADLDTVLADVRVALAVE